MSDRRYPDAILLAQQAKKDLRAAERRYTAAIQECLVPGTQITFTKGDRRYTGHIVSPPSVYGFVMVHNDKTGKEYELALYHIDGLAG